MKKWIILIFLSIVATLTMVVWADTYSTANYSTSDGDAWVIGGGGNTGTLTIDPDGSIIFEGDTADAYETIFAITDPTGDRTITFPNSSGTVALTTDSGNTLDEAYDQGGAGVGKKINADTGAVEIEVADGSNNGALLLDNDDTNDLSVLQITNAGSGSGAVSIDIDGQATGRDIEGTDASWYISGAGAATFTTFYQTNIAAAASGNTDLYIDAGLAGSGTITFGNSSTGKITTDNLVDFAGHMDIGDSVASDTLSILASIDKDVYIDDGVTNSPTLYLKDATDETFAIVKLDDGDTQVTIPADTDFEIVAGNLMVGTGTAGTVAMDGEDMYVHGDAEFNGTVQIDGLPTSSAGLTVTGAAVNINVASNYTINLATGNSTGTVTVGGTGTQSIAIGNGGGVKTVALGSNNGASATTILSGSGNLTINSTAGAATTGIGAGTTTGTVTIGGSGTQAIAVGTGGGAKAVSLGSNTGASATTILSGSGNLTVNHDAGATTTGIGTGTTTGAISIGGGSDTLAINTSDWNINATGDMTNIGAITSNGLITGTLGATITGATIGLNDGSSFAVNMGTGASTGTVTIGGTAGQTIAIGTGAAAKTVSLGSLNSTSTTTLLSGSSGILLNNSNNQPVSINSGTSTGTTTIGGTGIMTINIGAGGTGAKTIAIGHGDSTGTTTILSGTGGLGINTGTGTQAVTIGGTSGAQTIAVGTGGGIKTVSLGSATGASATTVSAGTGGLTVSSVDDLSIALTSTLAADDFVIAQTGKVNASMLISAEGTGTDAIKISTTGASGANSGDIDIDSYDAITVDSANDITITPAGTGASAFSVQSGGGVDMLAVADFSIALTSGEAGEDILLDQNGENDSGISLIAEGTGTDAIKIQTIGVLNTNSGDIDIDSIDRITIDAPNDVDITSSAGTGADTVKITATSGGITLASGTALAATAVSGSSHAASAVADGQKGITFSGVPAGGTYSEGVAAYFEANLGADQDVDGKVYAIGSWVNITGDCVPTDVPDSIISAADFGIYAAAAPTLTASKLRVLNIEYQVHSSAGTPEQTTMMHFNCDDAGDTPDYWFTTGNIAATAYEVNATGAGNKAGAIKVYIGAQGVRYIWLYTDAGSV